MEQTVILISLFVTVIFLELELLELFKKNNCFAHPYFLPKMARAQSVTTRIVTHMHPAKKEWNDTK
jgi:hypothetical protein